MKRVLLVFIMLALVFPFVPRTAYAQTMNVDEIMEDPILYYGRSTSIEGVMGRSITDNAFTLKDEDIIDLDQEEILVVDGTVSGLDFLPVNDSPLLVTGTIRRFDEEAIEEEYGIVLDDIILREYFAEPVIVATSVSNLEMVEPLNVDEVVTDPIGFYGQTVTVRGELDENFGERAFTLFDEDLVDLDQESLLVLDTTIDGLNFIALEESTVEVTGVVQEFNQAVVEEEYGIELAGAVFQAYEGRPMILASFANNIDVIEPVSVGMVTSEPMAFHNELVNVSGTVGERINPRAFLLRDDDLVDPHQEEIIVLNISPDGFDLTPIEDSVVYVTGTVKSFNRLLIEEEYNIQLDRLDFAQYEDKLVIIANSYVTVQ